jgi:UDP-3-O-[3-hydroxymyristoyl] glucosamine N-acyltransferase
MLSALADDLGLELVGEDRQVSYLTLANAPGLGPGGLTYVTSAAYMDIFLSGPHESAVLDRRLRDGGLPAGKSVLMTPAYSAEETFFQIQITVAERKHMSFVDAYRGERVVVSEGAFVADNVHIGDRTQIGSGAVILANSILGSDVVIKPNATVGGDGFEVKVIGGRRRAIPHTGGVFIGDDSQVGSSTCIDRALFNTYTVVGRGTMIDNLVHIAHNVRIGQGSAIVAGAEVSGSAILGSGVWYGPQASCNPEIRFGDYSFVGTGSVVVRDVPAHTLVAGVPARPLGTVCKCRARLELDDDVGSCDACGATVIRDAQTGEVKLAE